MFFILVPINNIQNFLRAIKFKHWDSFCGPTPFSFYTFPPFFVTEYTIRIRIKDNSVTPTKRSLSQSENIFRRWLMFQFQTLEVHCKYLIMITVTVITMLFCQHVIRNLLTGILHWDTFFFFFRLSLIRLPSRIHSVQYLLKLYTYRKHR